MFTISKNVVINNIRSSKFVLFNALFPIFLMIIIGMMLKGDFSSSSNLKDINITYYNQGSEESNLVFDIFKSSDFDINIKFEEVSSIEDGKHSARLAKSTFIHLNNENIDIYANDNSTINNYTITSILSSINKQVNLNQIIINENNQIYTKNREFINDENINIEKLPAKQSMSSFDYYSIVHITMIAVYSSLFPICFMRSEREYNLKDRIKIAGISNAKYYVGSFIGYAIIGMMCITPGYLFGHLVLKVNLGQNILLPYILIMALSMMCVALGMIIEAIFKEADKVASILQGVILPIMAFLGGSYGAFGDNVGGFFQILTHISPIRWANRSIFRVIYSSDYTMYIGTIIIFSLLCITLVIGTIVISDREERLI